MAERHPATTAHPATDDGIPDVGISGTSGSSTDQSGSPAPADPSKASAPTSPTTTPARQGFGWFGWFAFMAVTLLVLAGFVGYKVGTASRAPSEGSADVGFARDMQTHHNQAVQMAITAREKSTDPTVRAVAYDIITSQQQQAGQMYGWLVQWGLPQTADQPGMTWMTAGGHQPERGPGADPTDPAAASAPARPATDDGHEMVMGSPGSPATSPGSGGIIPGMSGELAMGGMGMASPAQLRELEQARGAEAERLFLQLMITHHQGGVKMAQAARQLAQRPEVITLAQAIDTAQQAEIRQLQQLLAERQ